ncbi:MAG: glutathione S-transferase family protein [Sphingobium sp.]|nr:glutathione S-transferase family protein [Sphingobium sp.]
MTGRLTLYHTPGTCSRVVLNALEELGLDYVDRPIDIFKGEQQGAAYLAIDAKGKVPALMVGDTLLTEAPAILSWLDGQHDNRLLPGATALARAAALGDLVWCSNSLHPLVRMVRMPHRVSASDPASVRESAAAQLAPLLAGMDARLASASWWFGETWSIVDVYLAWIVGMWGGAGMPLSDYPALAAHADRVATRESYRRAFVREELALTRSGIELPGGARL